MFPLVHLPHEGRRVLRTFHTVVLLAHWASGSANRYLKMQVNLLPACDSPHRRIQFEEASLLYFSANLATGTGRYSRFMHNN